MDIRRNADRLTLIYTATLSRFGSGPCIRRPTAVQARSHLNTQLPNADTLHFFFGPRKRGVRPHPPNPPWLRACLVNSQRGTAMLSMPAPHQWDQTNTMCNINCEFYRCLTTIGWPRYWSKNLLPIKSPPRMCPDPEPRPHWVRVVEATGRRWKKTAKIILAIAPSSAEAEPVFSLTLLRSLQHPATEGP